MISTQTQSAAAEPDEPFDDADRTTFWLVAAPVPSGPDDRIVLSTTEPRAHAAARDC